MKRRRLGRSGLVVSEPTRGFDFVDSTIVGATTVEQRPDLLRGADVDPSGDVRKACDQVTRDISTRWADVRSPLVG